MKPYVGLCAALISFMGYATQEDVDKLVDLSRINDRIAIECMYATYNNFTGQRIYPAQYYKKCYLLKEVALQLDKVQKELEEQGVGLLIWDAFRPMEGQKRLWDVFPVPGFVADPSRGGRHTRGTTVDCTLIDRTTGEPLDMGVGFDVFIDRARSDCTTICQNAQKNRKLLQETMAKYGFDQLETEWWHFDYHTMEQCPPLDVSWHELPE